MITQSSPASRTAPDPDAPLSLVDAQALACRFAVPVDACDTVTLREALDRVLAADVSAPFDIPAYDNSAMDGYAFDGAAAAFASAQGEVAMPVAGTAFAGHPFDGLVAVGACVRIMTGAPMPAGCDTVIPQERVRVDGDTIRFAAHDVARGANCRRAGEDLARGACALAAGRILRPSDLGLLASFGIADVTVRRRVRVAVFSTGDELREPGEPLGRGALYDSNRGMLIAMLERLHVDTVDLGIVRDDPAALEAALRAAIAAQADAVITSGGVSVGEADFTRDVMARLGDVTFASLALRPGRPRAVLRPARQSCRVRRDVPCNRAPCTAQAGRHANAAAGHVHGAQYAAVEEASRPHRIPARRRDARRRRPMARRAGRIAKLRVVERSGRRQLFHRPGPRYRGSRRGRPGRHPAARRPDLNSNRYISTGAIRT